MADPNDEPEELTAIVDDQADELVALVNDADELFVTLEEAAELGSVVTDEQGMRGPRGFRGAPGPQGPDGRDGAPGGDVLFRSSGPLSGGRVVAAVDAERVRAASSRRVEDAPALIGVTRYAVSEAEATVEVVRLGRLDDSAWSFVPLRPVFVGPYGDLTQSPDPDAAFECCIGLALSPTRVFVDLSDPILGVSDG